MAHEDPERLTAAIERLTDAERFAEAETIVARAAPDLQRVLASAMAEGGWFGDSHEAEALRAATVPDPDERITAVQVPARRGGADGDDGWGRGGLGIEGGVDGPRPDQRRSLDGHPLPRAFVLRTERR